MPTPTTSSTSPVLPSLLTPQPIDPSHALPEVVDTQPYVVKDSLRACTSAASREFTAPLADTPEGRGIRLHELAHLKWSPADGAASFADIAPAHVIGAFEDIRVNRLVLVHDPELQPILDAGYFDAQAIAAINAQLANAMVSPHRKLLLHAIARASGQQSKLTQKLGSIDSQIVNSCVSLVCEDLTFKGTIAAAKHFVELVAMVTETSDTLAAMPSAYTADDDGDRSTLDNGARMLYETISCDIVDTEYGTMTVREAPLIRSIAAYSRLARRARASDQGSTVKYMHRYALDGAIFGGSRRWYGGTLLIDHSGSMRVTADAIQALVAVAPHALVAHYDGDGRKHNGILEILVKSGRMADAEHISVWPTGAGSNVIDGPAAEWLLKQRGPRVWVTDQLWTGRNEKLICPALFRETMATVQRGHILIVPSIAVATKYFTDLYGGRK